MVSEQSLERVRSRVDAEGLLDVLMSKVLARGELIDLFDTASHLTRNFLTVDRVEIVQLSADALTVRATSSNCDRLPVTCGRQYPAGYLPLTGRELLLGGTTMSRQERCQQFAIDLQDKTVSVYSIQTTTIGTTRTQKLQSQFLIGAIGSDGRQDLLFDGEYLAKLRTLNIRSCWVVPIVHHQKLWGLLLCHHTQPKSFDLHQLQTIQSIVDRLVLGIDRSQLLTIAKFYDRRERLVQRISTLLHSAPSATGVEPELLAEIVRSLGADGGRLLILGEPLAQRAQIFTYGLQPNIATPIEKNPLWQKILTHQTSSASQPNLPEQIEDIYEQPFLAPLLTAFHTREIRSLLIIPLRHSHQCVGCLTLFRSPIAERPHVWKNDELNLAQSLAMHLYLVVMQRRLERMLRHQAYYDPLTGLPNRLLFHQRLTVALAKIETTNQILAVISLDLDRFKTINDSLGHILGDRLIQLVSKRLEDTLKSIAIVARWTGDEFTILVPDLDNIESVQTIANLILNCFQLPFTFDRDLPDLHTNSLHIKASIGIAIAPSAGDNPDTLLKHADLALDRAKSHGKNNYEIYNKAIAPTAIDRLKIENMLYKAIEHDRLLLHYQPQIDTQTGKIIGVEALLRCQDAQSKLISPAAFIPVAEETGIIDRLGIWVLRIACQQNKLWQEMNIGFFPIAINLSVRQLKDPNLIPQITSILAETELDPAYLEVEITESIAIQDLDLTIEILASLQKIGVKISLDDFGTGYSSLAALKYLPLDRLKIDRSFIQDLKANTVDVGIVKTIINLGHELALNVIAEGVETTEQFDLLKSIDCNAVQGFLFSRPLPAQDLAALIIRGGDWARE